MPPISIMQIKEIVNAGLNAPLDTALMLERKALSIAIRHAATRRKACARSWRSANRNSKASSVAGSARGDLIVAVFGAGTMGRGIAQVCAQAGLTTLLFDARDGRGRRGDCARSTRRSTVRSPRAA